MTIPHPLATDLQNTPSTTPWSTRSRTALPPAPSLAMGYRMASTAMLQLVCVGQFKKVCQFHQGDLQQTNGRPCSYEEGSRPSHQPDHHQPNTSLRNRELGRDCSGSAARSPVPSLPASPPPCLPAPTLPPALLNPQCLPISLDSLQLLLGTWSHGLRALRSTASTAPPVQGAGPRDANDANPQKPPT